MLAQKTSQTKFSVARRELFKLARARMLAKRGPTGKRLGLPLKVKI